MTEDSNWLDSSISEEFVPPSYVNRFEIVWANFDFLWSFHHVFKFPSELNRSELVKSEVSNLVMSPQLAKAISIILGDQIAKYESRFGTIEVDEESLKR